MPKSELAELAEQWLGHALLLGFGLGTLLGPFAIPLYLIREFTRWRLPWPFRGQWPPGNPYLDQTISLQVTSMARVEDMAKDLRFTLLGYATGQLCQIVLIAAFL